MKITTTMHYLFSSKLYLIKELDVFTKLVSFTATGGDHAENQKDRFPRYGEIYCSVSKKCIASGLL